MELRALDGRWGTVSLGKRLDDSHAGLSLGSLPVLRGGICHTHGRQVEAGGASILPLFSSLWSPWERGVRLRSSGEILTVGVTPVLSLFALTSLLESQLRVCWELTPPAGCMCKLLWFGPVRGIGGSLDGGEFGYLSSALSALVASLAEAACPPWLQLLCVL